jgi:K+-transporting ATPase c subunit
MLSRIMMVRQCKAKKLTSVLSAYTQTMSMRTLGTATISKTVNVLSLNKMYFV